MHGLPVDPLDQSPLPTTRPPPHSTVVRFDKLVDSLHQSVWLGMECWEYLAPAAGATSAASQSPPRASQFPSASHTAGILLGHRQKVDKTAKYWPIG